MAHLSISLLGPFQVLLDDREVTGFESDKVRALLAYLALESDRPHRREALAGLLWPQRLERDARHNLSQALFSLRRALSGCPILTMTRQSVQFSSVADCWLDVTALTALWDAYEQHLHRRLDVCDPCIGRLHRAVDLYRGSFLQGFSLGDSPAFEEWMLLQQERFHRLAVDAFRRLTRCHQLRGESDRALQCARRYARLEPWREDAHRQVMRLLAIAGRRNAALAQYEVCRQILKAELGVEPEEGTIALYRTIRDGEELPAEASLPPHNLPAPYTPFVGREAELAAIVARLRDPACRLLTLVGPGGIGKTRLALEAATDVLYADRGHRFAHGVYFVSLAPLRSPEAIVPTIAQAVGFAFRMGGDPRQQLLDYLRRKAMLLILDNVEHLLGQHGLGECSMDPVRATHRDGVSVVTGILQTAPNVKVLVTSRARLNVHGEHLLPIPGMDVPASIPTDHLEVVPGDITCYSAVRLFLEGARRVRPRFQPTQDDLAHIGRICRLVQGMPLGILLAAAWMRMLAPARIAAEIAAQVPGHGIDFLETAWADVPQRQRSMCAVFDHSWRLLPEREREVLRGLSVFCGGFTHAAAQQVVGATLRELRGLVDHSMLECGPVGRYEMHVLLRQYGNERLGQAPGGEQAIRDRHCAYYVGFLQDREARLTGSEQREALAEIEAEIDNVRAAWNWAVSQGRIEDLDRSLASLAEFYHMRAWFHEGEAAFACAAQRLAKEGPNVGSRPGAARLSALVLGKILSRQGWFCSYLGMPEKASELLRESLVVLRELGARREIAYASFYLGGAFSQRGRTQHQEALEVFREIGDRRGIAISLCALCNTFIPQGEYKVARRLAEESLALFRQLGNQQGTANVLGSLGVLAWMLGEYEKAQRLHQESYALFRDIGDREGMGFSLARLARTACVLEEYGEARRLYQESLDQFRDTGNLVGTAMALGDLGEASIVFGEYDDAMRLAQESLALEEKFGFPIQQAWAWKILGNAACGLGDYGAARGYFCRALAIGMSARATGPNLLTLVGVADLMAGEGKRNCAVALLALVLRHPATWQYAKDRATPLVARLKVELSAGDFAVAWECGQTRDLDTTVTGLLKELEQAKGPALTASP